MIETGFPHLQNSHKQISRCTLSSFELLKYTCINRREEMKETIKLVSFEYVMRERNFSEHKISMIIFFA